MEDKDMLRTENTDTSTEGQTVAAEQNSDVTADSTNGENAPDTAGAERPAAQEPGGEEVPIVFEDDFDANSDEYIEMLEHTTNSIAGNVEEQPRYERPKLPFKEAVEDFWYHHKTKVMIIGVVLVMAAIIAYQSIPEKYDYTFLIFSNNYYFDDLALQTIAGNLEQYGEDLDGDGEVKVHALRYDSFSSDYNEYMVSRVYMAEEFRKQHEAYLVLTDKAHYDVLVDEEEGFGEGLFESYDGMDKWIDATDSGLFVGLDGAFSTNDADKQVGLSLVALNDTTAANKTFSKRHDDAEEMLGKILEDHPELKTAE